MGSITTYRYIPSIYGYIILHHCDGNNTTAHLFVIDKSASRVWRIALPLTSIIYESAALSYVKMVSVFTIHAAILFANLQ